MTAPVILLFDSGSGHTETLAGFVSTGIEQAGGTAQLINLADGPLDLARLNAAAAIVFGTPTYMGGVSARFKTFMDDSAAVWHAQPWRDKIAAAFTVGGNRSGDKLASLQHLAIFAAQHGMIWVGQDLIGPSPKDNTPRGINADGSWLGLMATQSSDPDQPIPAGDAETATNFGTRIAHAVARWA
jgi:NAD(P)H dehydrogenase (quinone)